MNLKDLVPGLDWMKAYRRDWWRGDLSAGLTVGVMLIPQGMAYAMIAGLPPIYGLYASILPIIVYSFLGTSRQLGVGPVALVSLLVASGVGAVAEAGSEAYIQAALLLAMLVGLIQAGIGFLRFGFLVNFLSHPVISGFTSAAALIIGLSQAKHLLGVDLPRSKHLHELVLNIAEKIPEVHLTTFLLGLGGILLILGARRIDRRIPAPLLAVVFGIAAVKIFGLDSKGVSIVGSVPSGLPSVGAPSLEWSQIQQLLPIALTIALISFMESYAVAMAIQKKHRDYQLNANKELIALGLANVAGAFFQAYPTTGGFSRSAVNDQAGAKSGMAGLIAATLIIVTLLFLTPLFYFLPKAVLASVILVAVAGLIDFKEVRYLWKADRRDLAMLLITFSATAFLGLEAGIGFGAGLSILALVYRASRPHYAVLGEVEGTGIYRNIRRFREAIEPDNTLIIRPDSGWHYANSNYLQEAIQTELSKRPEVSRVLIDGSGISDLDSSASHMIAELHEDLGARSIGLEFANLIGPVRDRFERSGLTDRLGTPAFSSSIAVALKGPDEKHQDLSMQTGVLPEFSSN